MENASKNTYCPDYAIPPGETLAEVIHDRGMTQAELAERMGRPTKTINEIVKGKAAITPETAIQLERVLGVPARFWNSLEKNYREDLGSFLIGKSERHMTYTDLMRGREPCPHKKRDL